MAVSQLQINRKVREQLRLKPVEEVPDKAYLLKCRVDVKALEWTFRSLRVTRRDAFLDIYGSAIRLVHLFDPSTQTNRRKLKAEHYFVIRELKGDPKKRAYRISRKDIVDALRRQDVRYEKAAQGQLVCKAPLAEVIVHLDKLLRVLAQKHRDDDRFLYSNASARSRLISRWVNWFFKTKYGIESTYNPEQIRKLIKATRRRTAA